MLGGIKESIRKFIKGAGSYEKAVNDFIKELQKALIKADVNVRVVFDLTRRIREKALKTEPPPWVSRREWFIKIVYDELSQLFGGDKEPNVFPKRIPYVILLVGVQGSGKTTTAGKLALYYKKQGYRACLLTTDTYRPGAYDQLKQIAEQINVPFYGEPNGKDPAMIANEGIKRLKKQGCEVIIIDTAGRHGYGSEAKLLEEMRDIASKVHPDEVILVIDAAMGQKSFDLAKRFHEYTPIGSIVIAKLDGTAKGGGALAAVVATNATIKFIGTGEKLDELEVFNPRRYVARLLGLGDLETLIEKFKALEESEEFQKRIEKAVMSGKITLREIYLQIKSLRKLGPLRKVLELLPVATLMPIKDEHIKLTEEKMRKWLAII
ncbi:MAG TPA: signal recognition particle protein Srp19, partial [Acidilobales archaeon]|nr:signal recognition particle protein Srp19 [Acidilobales archaeon]